MMTSKVTEKARLLRRYKEVHPNATSEQIGVVVFNMNAATVRGMDIFLDLPKEVQAALITALSHREPRGCCT